MKVLVVGSRGQLGNELLASVPQNCELVGVDIGEIDITDMQSVISVMADVQPTLVINAAAYTAVDKAESEHQLAYAVNEQGAANLAKAVQMHDARLFHISTDFVFDGARSTPYPPDTSPSPLSVYGASKAAGEQQVQQLNPDALIVRTAWVYSCYGANFVKTMLRLMDQRDELSVVNDQVGSPSWAAGLAQLLWRCVELPEVKGMHQWTDEGVISWYDFACAIQAEGKAAGLLKSDCMLHAITAAEYPTDATRPAYSVLDCSKTVLDTGLKQAPWRDSLHKMVASLVKENGVTDS